MLKFSGSSCLIWDQKKNTAIKILLCSKVTPKKTIPVEGQTRPRVLHIIYALPSRPVVQKSFPEKNQCTFSSVIYWNHPKIFEWRQTIQQNCWERFTDTQTNMLPEWKRNVRSKFEWFTRSCNSHYVSHFAAFFIVVGAKTSIAESCKIIRFQIRQKLFHTSELVEMFALFFTSWQLRSILVISKIEEDPIRWKLLSTRINKS